MKLEFKLAYRNIKGAGLRTWLNVAILSFLYVLIIAHQGIFNGMMKQGARAEIDDRIAGGQYWHEKYDPYDPFSYDESHGKIPPEINRLIENDEAAAVLIKRATIYPRGRMRQVLLRGIDPEQKVIGLPTEELGNAQDDGFLPVMVGVFMAGDNSLKEGDFFTIRLRDVHGAFDAVQARVVKVMSTKSMSIDKGQVWMSLSNLRKLTDLQGQATMVIVGDKYKDGLPDVGVWKFKDRNYLLRDIISIVRSKRVSAGILYVVLLFLALLAVFDTQVLAVFKRKKEIGTLIALGMTKKQVVKLFTLEGMMHGILAAAVGAVYGIPLMRYLVKTGLGMPAVVEEYGYAFMRRLYPSYSIGLVLGTIAVIMISVTIVSYWPARKIAALDPTDALKGK